MLIVECTTTLMMTERSKTLLGDDAPLNMFYTHDTRVVYKADTGKMEYGIKGGGVVSK
jgi:hypothetical protein